MLFRKKVDKPKLEYNPYRKIAFGAIIFVAIFMAFTIKGFVLGGMFAGILATAVVWTLVLKFPERIQIWMVKHQLLADLFLTMFSASILAGIGSGVTIFVAIATQGLLISGLLKTL